MLLGWGLRSETEEKCDCGAIQDMRHHCFALTVPVTVSSTMYRWTSKNHWTYTILNQKLYLPIRKSDVYVSEVSKHKLVPFSKSYPVVWPIFHRPVQFTFCHGIIPPEKLRKVILSLEYNYLTRNLTFRQFLTLLLLSRSFPNSCVDLILQTISYRLLIL